MPKSQTIKPAIYQIDLDRVASLVEQIPKQNSNNSDDSKDDLISYTNADKQIIRYHDYQRQQGLSKAMSYDLRLDSVPFGEFKVSVYSAQGRHPHAWTNLFGQTINDLFVSYPNLVAFISNENVCYAISAGQGHTLFEQFIDSQFALKIAKRIMTPTLDSTKRREISGAIYGQIQQYRTSQRIASSQTLGTVWNGLGGKITSEIRASSKFIEIFDPDNRAISVDAGSSLQVKKSIDIAKLPMLINWIEELLDTDLTEAQEKDFSFMNGLTQVPRGDKIKKEKLKLELAIYILNNLNDTANIDLDFSHRNFEIYQGSESYDFGKNKDLEDVSWDSAPSAPEVIAAIRDNIDKENIQSAESMLNLIKELRLFANQPDPTPPLNGTILDYLNGEIKLDEESYFLVDGTWYQASKDFLKRLTGDFINEINDATFELPDSTIKFYDYTYSNDNEGGYNKSYLDKDNWLVTDKTFIERVEIADLIHWANNKLYIVHNKIGYGASVRDVCSQISLSMNVLNTIASTPHAILSSYYADIIREHYSNGTSSPLSEDEFIKLLQNTPKDNIVFVIGYIKRAKVDENILSSIAKYETVKLISDSKLYRYGLKIKHIPRP